MDFKDLTRDIERAVTESGVENGLAIVFAPHATGVIVFTEFEGRLLNDIKMVLKRLLPRELKYEHPVNAHSHIRSMFLGPGKVIPVVNGRPTLGTWQSVFWIEVDHAPRTRKVLIEIIGE